MRLELGILVNPVTPFLFVLDRVNSIAMIDEAAMPLILICLKIVSVMEGQNLNQRSILHVEKLGFKLYHLHSLNMMVPECEDQCRSCVVKWLSYLAV